jgi:transcriptional regulator with XRE-family HTH domain
VGTIDTATWDFADYLRHVRDTMTQAELAAKIGVGQRTVSRWLRRESGPGADGWRWLYGEFPHLVQDEGLVERTRARVRAQESWRSHRATVRVA